MNGGFLTPKVIINSMIVVVNKFESLLNIHAEFALNSTQVVVMVNYVSLLDVFGKAY